MSIEQYDEFVKAAESFHQDPTLKEFEHRLSLFSKSCNAENAWYIHTYLSLYGRLKEEFECLQQAFKASTLQLPKVAWHARNMLELKLWIYNCGASIENAKLFFKDAALDRLDLVNVISQWNQKNLPKGTWESHADLAITRIKEAASTHNLKDISASYQKTHEVSKTLDIGEDYQSTFKMFSKFAHPTALAVLDLNGERQTHANLKKQVIDLFYGHGCVLFLTSLNHMKNTFKDSI